ncbi:MAG: FAD-dependent oxidoreductase, partial [Methanosarcinales archaeon]
MKQYDLIILGGGASAYAAAIKASEFNAKVAMVTNALGGTCVNVGCVPSKHLLTVGEIYHYSKENNFKGIKLRQEYLNFSEIISQKDKLVEKLRKEKYIEVLDFLPNVDLYKSSATFCSENEVELNNEKEILKADKFIIATGSSPNI